MSQHDFEIANQTFPAFRSDLNNALQALVSSSAGASEPTTTFAYQLWYDSTNDLLKMRNADDDAWITLFSFNQSTNTVEVSGEELVDDTTPQLGGDLDTNGNDINFGDNDKAIFGAGSDLEISHNGTENVIDSNAGTLVLRSAGAGTIEMRDQGSQVLAQFNDNSDVKLYHNNNPKLATTSTGVDVTGTVTADDNIVLSGASTPAITITDTTNNATSVLKAGNVQGITGTTSNHDFFIRSNDTNRIGVAASGDISFYADDGTTQGLFWDASAESLGIGTTSPSSSLGAGGLHVNDRIAVHSGSVGTPALHNRFDTDTGIFFGTGIVGVSTGGTERMRIDSSGNVGINEASPDRTLHVNSGSSNVVAKFESTDSIAAIEFADSGGSAEIGNSGNDLVFFPAGAERMRIDSSGHMLVGTTDNAPWNNSANSSADRGIAIRGDGLISAAKNDSDVLALNRTGSNGAIAVWYRSGSSVGSVSVTTSSTSYNTSSDHRLKENAVDLTGAITRVKSLQPKRFNFIADDSTTVDGFMAHEAQSVVPEAVTGTHNEVDADGNPVYQGIDQSKLVPLLTAALQEAIAKIETLETKVTALEGN